MWCYGGSQKLSIKYTVPTGFWTGTYGVCINYAMRSRSAASFYMVDEWGGISTPNARSRDRLLETG